MTMIKAMGNQKSPEMMVIHGFCDFLEGDENE